MSVPLSLVCWKALPKRFLEGNSALLPDVRKRSALPSMRLRNQGCARKTGRSPKTSIPPSGKAKGLPHIRRHSRTSPEFFCKAYFNEFDRGHGEHPIHPLLTDSLSPSKS